MTLSPDQVRPTLTSRQPAVRSSSQLALPAIAVTVLAWASAFVGIRRVGRQLDPGSLALGRLLIGVLALGVTLAWFAAYNVSLNAAGQRVDAGTAAVLVNIGPILIAVGAGLVLGEGFPRLPTLQFTWLACLAGAIACLPPLPSLGHQLRAAAPSSIMGLAYLGLVPTSLAFCTWAYALARTDAGRLGVTTYLVPQLTIGFGWVGLAERPAGLAVVGGLICLVGVALSRRGGTPDRGPR